MRARVCVRVCVRACVCVRMCACVCVCVRACVFILFVLVLSFTFPVCTRVVVISHICFVDYVLYINTLDYNISLSVCLFYILFIPYSNLIFNPCNILMRVMSMFHCYTHID